MRIHAVSDVHGAWDSLAGAADGADVFICLGDLLLYLDYEDPSEGAFSEIFGAELTAEYIRLRTAKRFTEARELTNQAWAAGPTGGDPAARREVFTRIIDRQYSALFDAMPAQGLFTCGNVDVPALWPNYLKPGHIFLDGQTIDVDGVRFGFAGGGLYSPYSTPNEISPDAFAEKINALGPVDVLCTHIPPSVAELTFDVVAARFEVGSQTLLDVIRDTSPRYSLFGHVHQPLANRLRIGTTECINVGHFRARRRPFVLDI